MNQRQGTLLIIDDLNASPENPIAHGVEVEASARDTGYQGAVFTQQHRKDTQLTHQVAESYFNLGNQKLSPEEARNALTTIQVQGTVNHLNSCSNHLNQMTRNGAQNGVTNFSSGTCPAHRAEKVYAEARAAWGPPVPNPADLPIPPDSQEYKDKLRNYQKYLGRVQLMENLATGFGIKADDLRSSDPEVSGPARQKLQQALVNHLAEANKETRVEKARTRYLEAEDLYTSRYNSVVVASGNSGDLGQDFSADNGGREVTWPDNFFRSDLAGPHATIVGATDFKNGQPQVTDYTSGPEIDLYAHGRSPFLSPGTSFAAPRVAAVMAQLRAQHPGASREFIEKKAIEIITTSPETGKIDSGKREQSGAIFDYMSESNRPAA